MKRVSRMIVAAVLLGAGTAAQPAEPAYDLVIAHGRVIDPASGLDAVRNVGIRGTRIAAITEQALEGARVIDARGLVVAPGFIDLHVHVLDLPFGQKLLLQDGVTTQLELEGGVFPVERFYAYMHGRSQANYGASVSTLGVREKVFHPDYESLRGTLATDIEAKLCCSDGAWRNRVADATERAAAAALIERGLREGALGVGVLIGYMAEAGTSQEILAWQRLAGRYGRASFVHARFSSQQPPATGVLAIQEWLGAAAAYGGGVWLHHVHQQVLALTDEALAMIDAARARGFEIRGEVYPYDFGATSVSADFLEPANYARNMGRDYADITEIATMQPLDRARYEHLRETDPFAMVLFNGATAADSMRALLHPEVAVGADAVAYRDPLTGARVADWDTPYADLNGHPRVAGSHAKVLRLSRESDALPLMRAIRKMSYLQAQFLVANGVPAMAAKGRVAAGADADLTLFDPLEVGERATRAQPALPSAGIPYVIVAGTVVVDATHPVPDVYPGRPVRAPVTQ